MQLLPAKMNVPHVTGIVLKLEPSGPDREYVMPKVVMFVRLVIVKRMGLVTVRTAAVPKSRVLGVIVIGVGPPIGVGDAVGVEVAVLVGVLVAVGVLVFVGVGLADGVKVGVGEAVGVGVGVLVDVGVHTHTIRSTEPLSQAPATGNGRGWPR